MQIEPQLQPLKIAPVITEQDVLAELDTLLTRPARTLGEFLSAIVFGGEEAMFKRPLLELPVFRTTDTSGYNFSYNNKMVAYLRFGVTKSHYFVVQSLLLSPGSAWVSHYYGADGRYAFSEGPASHEFAEHPVKFMEPKCPVLNHIYNILAANYAETKSGKINTKQIHTLEGFLRKLNKTRFNELSVSRGIKDPAIQDLRKQMIEIELDPVYTWKERHHLISSLRQERADIVTTKRRAHRISRFRYFPALFTRDMKDLFIRFGKRPFSNTLGILERILLDPLRWFWSVVKDNMGYSIALAIYSPFTFFFITQPMNPHAMWAVGNVRSAYLQTVDKVSNAFHFGAAKTAEASASAAVASTAGAASTAALTAAAIPASNDVIANMPVTANRPDINNMTWDDRMSNFKALQINYEENLEIAPRMGRLEQMETQLNWPMILESAWLETDRYLNFLTYIEGNAKDYAPAFVDFVKAEHARVDQVQVYLWDKNIRFILDHPYTVMDQSKEQTQNDYYVGRSFILLRDMTIELSGRYRSLPLPKGYIPILKLAQSFESQYKNGGSVLDRLKNNSKVFAQNDPTSTQELREYMKRQWEVLYLLQNKAQEAANNGLQLYIWSVRNTAYLIQSMYSSKREEMSLIAMNMRKGNTVNKLSNNTEWKHIDSQYEALFHMFVLEFASVRKEIGDQLKNDLEATQRKKIIDGVESFLKERDTLLKGANLL
ncbi:MAG: hypothetical protein JST80_12240 [Bdellovibrionales bacterium]|nr:hypothetical protein [Bdellovibrionales bacterium]